MKSLLIGIMLLFLGLTPAYAQSASVSASPSGSIKGVFDSAFDATASASPSATPRAVTYLDTSDAPASGAIENTLALLVGGLTLIIVGLRFSKI